MMIQLPGGKHAVNPRFVTSASVEKSTDKYGKPTGEPPYVVVRWTLGVQQMSENIKGVTLQEVIALLNQGETA
jgi:hypothetical protein